MANNMTTAQRYAADFGDAYGLALAVLEYLSNDRIPFGSSVTRIAVATDSTYHAVFDVMCKLAAYNMTVSNRRNDYTTHKITETGVTIYRELKGTPPPTKQRPADTVARIRDLARWVTDGEPNPGETDEQAVARRVRGFYHRTLDILDDTE